MRQQILVTKLNRLAVENGDVLHGMKKTDVGYAGFGEVYFSIIYPNAIKGWKRHRQMTLNLVVAKGAVKFVAISIDNTITEYRLSPTENHCRLTVPPNYWLGFQGESVEESVIMNLANIAHDASEVDTKPLSDFEYQW